MKGARAYPTVGVKRSFRAEMAQLGGLAKKEPWTGRDMGQGQQDAAFRARGTKENFAMNS